MNREEQQLLAGLFDRIRTAANTPRDRDAEAFIADSIRAQPYAPYLLAQTVIVQEQTMNAAAARIEELEARVRQLESAPAPAAQGSGSFLGGLFGGGQPARPAVPPAAPVGASPWSRAGAAPQQGMQGGAPAYAPPQQQQAAPWQQPQAAPAAGGGSSFLKTAAGAAVGVAGGMMLANSLSGMLGGGHKPFGSGNETSPASARGSDSALDAPSGYQNAAYGSGSSGESEAQPDAQYASYDDSNSDSGSSGYSDDSSDV